MDKRTFLERLQAALAGLPDAERERQLAYYEEMIDDRVEEGMSESEAIAALGPVDQLAQRVLRQTPPQQRADRVRRSGIPTAVWVLLAVLLLPLWLPLLGLAGALVLGSFALLFGLIVAAAGLVAGLGVGGVGAMIWALVSWDLSGMSVVFAIGAGLIAIGAALLLALPAAYLIKALWRGIKAWGRKLAALLRGERHD